MENTQNKRFEDWEKVDCNDCARYWDSSCDGVPKGSQRLCNSFLATRKVVIPEKIRRLEKAVNAIRVSIRWLSISGILVAISQIIHIIWGG